MRLAVVVARNPSIQITMKTESKHTPFPKVYGSATQSKHGSASLFTADASYNPFDATAPGMTPELALERAKYAADAINDHPTLLRQRDDAIEALKAILYCENVKRHSRVFATSAMKPNGNNTRILSAHQTKPAPPLPTPERGMESES